MSSFDYTVFNSDGSYSHNLTGVLMNEDVPSGCSAEEGSFGEDYYLDTLGVVPRRSVEIYHSSSPITANGSDKAEIQVPEFHGVWVTGPNGVSVPLTESEVVFSTPEPGAYTFVFTGIEILPREVTIYAA